MHLHKPVLVRLGLRNFEMHILWQLAEERRTLTNKDGNCSDDHVVHHTSGEEALYGDAAVDVDPTDALGAESAYEVGGALDGVADGYWNFFRKLYGLAAEH